MTVTMLKPVPPAWQAPRPSCQPARPVAIDEFAALDGLLAALPDCIDYPLLLVDGDGLLLLANRSGRRWLASDGPLRLEEGRVLAIDAARQRLLLSAMRSAVLGRRSLLGLDGIAIGGAKLAVMPLDNPLSAEPAVLLLGGRSRTCEPLSLDFFVRAHGITQAEAVVLRALCDGQAPAAIAKRSGVAVCTVRSQVASLRQKTGARTINDMVRQVVLLPPIMGLLG
jgi:DNA-binding CsgD family transcriptional regulator